MKMISSSSSASSYNPYMGLYVCDEDDILILIFISISSFSSSYNPHHRYTPHQSYNPIYGLCEDADEDEDVILMTHISIWIAYGMRITSSSSFSSSHPTCNPYIYPTCNP